MKEIKIIFFSTCVSLSWFSIAALASRFFKIYFLFRKALDCVINENNPLWGSFALNSTNRPCMPCQASGFDGIRNSWKGQRTHVDAGEQAFMLSFVPV